MGQDSITMASSEETGSLKNLVRLKFVEDRVVPWFTEADDIRVSSLSDLCAREEVLAFRQKFQRLDKTSADLNLIFAHGRALHYILQNEVLPALDVLLGVWQCLGCAQKVGSLGESGKDLSGLVRRPKMCESCGGEEFLYLEQHFRDAEYRIGGHPDGFLEMEGYPGLGIVECKSIGAGRAWEVRETPDIGHAIQAQAYMWLTGLQWCKILYWDKSGQGSYALMEHTVEREEEVIEEIKSMVQSIWSGLKDGALPDRICTSATCPKAKECELAEICFEGGK